MRQGEPSPLSRGDVVMVGGLYIDMDECTACGACVEECPGVFRLIEGRWAQVVNPDGASESEIRAAMEICPVQCIHWDD